MKNFKLDINWKAVCKVCSTWVIAAIVAFISSKLTNSNFVIEWLLLSAIALSFKSYDSLKSCDCAECVCESAPQDF